MPNLKITNLSPHIRVGNTIPNVRASNFQTGRVGDSVVQPVVGNPIGLLLTLTYAQSITDVPLYADSRPNMRIYNY